MHGADKRTFYVFVRGDFEVQGRNIVEVFAGGDLNACVLKRSATPGIGAAALDFRNVEIRMAGAKQGGR